MKIDGSLLCKDVDRESEKESDAVRYVCTDAALLSPCLASSRPFAEPMFSIEGRDEPRTKELECQQHVDNQNPIQKLRLRHRLRLGLKRRLRFALLDSVLKAKK